MNFFLITLEPGQIDWEAPLLFINYRNLIVGVMYVILCNYVNPKPDMMMNTRIMAPSHENFLNLYR